MEEYYEKRMPKPPCDQIPIEKQDVIDEETMKSFALNYNVMPLFEKQIQDYLRVKKYSIHSSNHLRCQWNEYINSSTKGCKRKCKFVPAENDWHFYKYHNLYAPTQSLKGKYNRFQLSDYNALKMRGNEPTSHETSWGKVRKPRVLSGKRKEYWK